MKNRDGMLFKVWATWENHAGEQRRQRSVLEKVALRMKNGMLFKVWATWAEHAGEQRRQRSGPRDSQPWPLKSRR